ncbi:MAG: tetratricopeptide repeat protein [Thermoanaerobaculaceae bacterium]|jgi:tetratricopeptide (TPR) repeat protein|nr:tetratricopeptide repeat protein [Thermoanaerobaculaceae bacterium]
MRPARVGHYRLDRVIETSTTHERFAAWDEQLERPVQAVGVPLEGVGVDDRERWRREVRAMAAVTHPAVVHILDIVHQDGSDWIISEWVEGASLEDLATRQPFATSEVVRMASELAEALAAVHHRHVTCGRVGLRRVLVTHAGHLKIGGFCLPPWAAIEPHELIATDRPAADLRALGRAILALLGKPVPPGQDGSLTLEEIREAIGTHGGALAPSLERLIAGLMALPGVPAYESLDEATAELHALAHRSQTATQVVPTVTRPSPSRRRWLPAALALALAVAGAAAGWWWWGSRRPLAVAVLPVEAPADTEDARLAATAVFDTVVVALAGVDNLTLAGRREVLGLHAAGRTDAEIARELAVDELVEIKLTVEPPQPGPWLELHRRRVRDGRELWSQRVSTGTWEPAALRELASELLRGAYRGDYASRGTSPLAASPAAFRSYLIVRDRAARRATSRELEEEISLLTSALADSPGFAEAWLLLAEQHGRRFAFHFREEDRARCEDAISRARAAGGSPVNVGLAEIGLATLTGQTTRAIELAEQLTRTAPGNPATWHALGNALSRAGHFDDAEIAFQRSIRLFPNATAHLALADMRAAHGDYDGARRALAEYRSRGAEDTAYKARVAEVEMYAGNHELAERLYRDLLLDRGTHLDLIHMANCLYYQGRFQEAETYYRRALDRDVKDFLARRNLADTLLVLGRHDEAREHYSAALAECEALPEAARTERSVLETRPVCLAQLGRRAEAASAVEALLAAYPRHPAALFTASLVAAVNRDREGAIAWAGRARRANAPVPWFRGPEFAGLQGEPRFEALLRPGS